MILVHHNGHRALQQHGRTGQLMRTQSTSQQMNLHIVNGVRFTRLSMFGRILPRFQPIQQLGHLAGVRRNHHLPWHTFGQQVKRAGIHHDWWHVISIAGIVFSRRIIMLEQGRYGFALHIRAGTIGIGIRYTGADDPGLYMSLADHGFRQRGKHHILGTFRSEIADHAGIRACGRTGRQHRGTRIGLRTSDQSDHAA